MWWLLLTACAVEEVCVDAPVVTWANFGQGFTTESCQPCHASTTQDRNGAPEDVVFDSFEALLDHRESVLSRVAGPSPSMPPEGGVSEEDRQLVEIRLTCWE